MLITITIISILAITTLAHFAKRILPFKVCPICAGVFLTWVGLFGARFLGYQINLVVPALLMGGTVVGIAYQLEKNKFGGAAPLPWKALFMSAGFAAAYGILFSQLAALAYGLAVLLASMLYFLRDGTSGARKEDIADIEKKMKDCC